MCISRKECSASIAISKSDVHGNGQLYGEPRNATTIDVHRLPRHDQRSGRRSDHVRQRRAQIDLRDTSNTPWGPRFDWEGDELYPAVDRCRRTCAGKFRRRSTRSIRVAALQCEVALMRRRCSATARTWGDVPDDRAANATLAHDNSNMDCQICHTSWATSCFGCHLPMKANQRVPLNKFEGMTDRNFTTYNPQVVRDDVFMLGIDGTVKKQPAWR